MFDAYKMGVAALKTTFKAAGLTEDSVAHTVTDVEEVILTLVYLTTFRF